MKNESEILAEEYEREVRVLQSMRFLREKLIKKGKDIKELSERIKIQEDKLDVLREKTNNAYKKSKEIL